MSRWTDDTPSDSSQLIRKILNLRLFDADAEPLPSETSTLPSSGLSSSIMPTVSPEAGVTEGSVSTPVKERSRAWKRSVMDIDGEVLCGKFPALDSYPDSRAKLTFTLLAGILLETVSQFTLMARTEKGSKPGQYRLDLVEMIGGCAHFHLSSSLNFWDGLATNFLDVTSLARPTNL